MSAPSSLDRLLRSWKLSLAAGNKSQNTIEVYSSALEAFQTWLIENGHPTEARKIEKQHVEGFIAYLLGSGRKPATAHNRYRALNTFFGWLVDEGGFKASPTQRVEPPMVPTQPTEVISLPVLKRLLRSLEGRDFRDRRDNAMIRLLLDSGMRREELAALKVTELDVDEQCAYVMGKGRRPRRCPFGKQTALALDRYLRMRDQHPRADSAALWLGLKGPMTGSGVYQTVDERSRQAGIEHLHPHRFRHTFAHQWLAEGGQEGDLMRLAGWQSRSMLQKYGASAADERAREAHKKLGLGDRL